MKPHPRIRKTVKWGGAAVSVVLMVVWVGSIWYAAQYLTAFGNGVSVGNGRANYFYSIRSDSPYPEPIKYVTRSTVPLRWWFFGLRSGPGWFVAIPLWFPLTLSLMATAAAWRLDSLARARSRAGLCPKCQYDLRGLQAGGKCPECGGEGSRSSAPDGADSV